MLNIRFPGGCREHHPRKIALKEKTQEEMAPGRTCADRLGG